ncbi:AraC family transcriptional regulator [Pseudomonas sp. NFXW11]|uniref:AraC family transcriptional regulator GliR n=1 Tax=Pseudomonas sp. NFXW11 TaxID=2819531 RepID=UPI003CF9C8FD
MPSLGYTSVPPLLKYLLYAEQLGLATAPALAAAGLTAAQLNDTSLRLPLEVHEQLLDYFCRHSGDPLFGLNSARFVKPSSWNVLGYITMNCATLGEAMGRIMPFEKLVGDMGTSRAELAGDEVRLIWSCRHQRADIRRHLVENVLASWLLYARWIADSELSPSTVWFEHPLPEGAEAAQYETLFGCPVLFQQSCSALVAPLHYLQMPLRQADARLLKTLEDHAQAMMASLADAPLALQVQNLLRQLLKNGLPRKEQVAEQLSMSERTLQRQLQQAGTSYQQILDDLRQELAEHYLLHSELSVEGIADCLGYSEQRSLHRAFKNRTGLTPGQFRQAALGAGKA